MYTIKELCAKSGLSRATLLYYESIGLLSAEGRSNSNYRLYSDDSIKWLERICTYRDAGVPLNDIVRILNYDTDVERTILEKTLSILNQKAKEIKVSQTKITEMLHCETEPGALLAAVDREAIMAALSLLGIGNDVFVQIHEILENNSSESHRALLKMCGFNEYEISNILNNIQKQTGESNDERKNE